MPSRAARRIGSSDSRTATSASVKSVRIAKWIRGIHVAERQNGDVIEERGDALGVGQHRGDDDHRPRVIGYAAREFEPGQPPRRQRRRQHSLNGGDGEINRRCDDERQRDDEPREGVAAPQHPRAAPPSTRSRDRDDRSEIQQGRVREKPSPRALEQRHPIADLCLEVPPAASNQIVADVRFTISRRSGRGGAAGQLDRGERHLQLPFARRPGDALDGLTLLIATEKVHPAVDARRIAPERVVHQTDVFELITRASQSPNTVAGS